MRIGKYVLRVIVSNVHHIVLIDILFSVYTSCAIIFYPFYLMVSIVSLVADDTIIKSNSDDKYDRCRYYIHDCFFSS